MQSSVGKNQGREGRPVREMIIIVAIRIIMVILMIKKVGRFVKLHSNSVSWEGKL